MGIEEPPFLISLELLRDRINSFDKYPLNIPFIQELDYIDFHQNVTFLVGENGVGKSTIMEAIATSLGYNAEGGNKNTNFSTNNTTSGLHKYIRLSRSYRKPKDEYFLRAESLYNVATYMDSIAPPEIQGYGGKSLHKQSHGESFLSVIQNKFKGNGLYLLDEPEAALSPSRQLSVLVIINELVKTGSQFIITTHSPILMAYPNAKIIQLYDSGLEEIKYTETEHYTITRDFINHHEKMLVQLFEE